MRDQLEYIPAHRLLQLFRTKQLSPIDILNAQIKRIVDAGPRINAITDGHFDEALKAASTSEARYHRGDARPLEGISVAVKEEYARRGWAVTAGSRLFKDEISDDNHPVIEKLLSAGAILHVQTTVPEFFCLESPGVTCGA